MKLQKLIKRKMNIYNSLNNREEGNMLKRDSVVFDTGTVYKFIEKVLIDKKTVSVK